MLLDPARFAELIDRATTAGLPAAGHHRALNHLTGLGVDPSLRRAYRELSLLAEDGMAESMILLGDMLVTGQGPSRDFPRARQLYADARAQVDGLTGTWADVTRRMLDGRDAEMEKIFAGEPYALSVFRHEPFTDPRPGETLMAARERGRWERSQTAAASSPPPVESQGNAPTVTAEEAARDAEDAPLRCAPGAPPRGVIVQSDGGGAYVTAAARRSAARVLFFRSGMETVAFDFALTRAQAGGLPTTGPGTHSVVDGEGRPMPAPAGPSAGRRGR